MLLKRREFEMVSRQEIEKTEDNLSVLNSNNGINRDILNETGTVSVRIKATEGERRCSFWCYG